MKDCHPVDRPTFAKNDYFVSTLNLITYGLNAIIFFQNLPIYSPLRASVLKNLTKGVEPGQAAKDFGVHTSTVYRALNKDDFSQTILRKPIEQRNLGDPARISIAKEFFDEAIPVLSGRKYRVKKCTNDNLYALYYIYAIDKCIEPLSKSYLIYNLLKKEYVHHSNDDTICPTCHSLSSFNCERPLTKEDATALSKLENHIVIANQQGAYLKEMKRKLSEGQLPETCLVVHDFTQIQVQGTFYQDLIICIYYYDCLIEGGLKRRYIHHVGSSSSEKNDINFVSSSWKQMFQSNVFEHIQTIIIMSDGGPKHFKITSCLHFFAKMQREYHIDICYNFFESYHGHSVCDGVASHTKKKLNVEQRDSQNPIKYSHEIQSTINKMKSSECNLYKSSGLATPNYATFNGIRSYYKFVFSHAYVFGFKLSSSETHTKLWPLQNL